MGRTAASVVIAGLLVAGFAGTSAAAAAPRGGGPPCGQGRSPTESTGGGLTNPWGVAVAGRDNVWIANFGGKRLSQFCGSRPANCPDGTADLAEHRIWGQTVARLQSAEGVIVGISFAPALHD